MTSTIALPMPATSMVAALICCPVFQWRKRGAQYRKLPPGDKRHDGTRLFHAIRRSLSPGASSAAVAEAVKLLVLAVYGGVARINLFVFAGLNRYGFGRG